MKSDTIVAVATPRGVGGVAVLRMSGAEARTLALRHLSAGELHPRRATFARFMEGDRLIDEVLATFFPAPHSYTGEDLVELSCHGSLYVQEAILRILVDDGARLAEAGEFTRRAFLAGKLNLSQAEAVADLIDSVTPAQHRLAVSQLRGGYARRLADCRQQLLDLTSLLELELDFSQEDVEFADRDKLLALIDTLAAETSALVHSFKMGNALKWGIPVAIVGAPNVGKSTLLNALLGDDRAIVSAIPGTTRDTIEECLTIGDVSFRLVDTAGIRHTDDEVERLGIERSRKASEEAMVVVEVVDASQGSEAQPSVPSADGKRHIVVYNKSDLLDGAHGVPSAQDDGTVAISLSALQGTGLDVLRKALLDAVEGGMGEHDILLSNARHYEALKRVGEALASARQGLVGGIPSDLVAVDLRDALYHLGTITGEVSSEDILSNIFSRFCIGK